ncbi:MAG: CRISPR-associated endonuclease Cas3'' [Nitrososphaerota archaeon]
MISDDILSYYKCTSDGQEVKESLRDHIRNGIDLIEDLDSSRISKFVASKLRVADFKGLVRQAIMFHDAGKAFYQTKDNMKEEKESGGKYLSFIGHESISAYIAEHFIKERKGYVPDHYSIVVAILFHHHAMGVERRRKEALSRLRKTGQAEFEAAKRRLREVLVQFVEDEDKEVLRKCLDELSIGDINNWALQSIENEIYERMILRRDPRFRKLSFTVLNCLLSCDYISAGARGISRSGFSQAISSFYRLWMMKTQT